MSWLVLCLLLSEGVARGLPPGPQLWSFGPHQTQQAPPTFRSMANLVLQTVVVKDQSGRPVEGLTARDFVLTEDGVVQDIAFVEYQRLSDVPAPAMIANPGAASPPATTAPVPAVTDEMLASTTRYRDRRLIVLYFDFHQMPFFDEMRVLEDAGRYVSTRMTAADMVALMVFDGRGVRLVHDFTDDRRALGDALQSLSAAAVERNETGIDFVTGGAFGDGDDTFNIFTTDRQLSALQRAVTGLGPLPELKTLVYLGSGLRLSGTDNMAQMRATVNAAVRSNVTINPVDARGLVASAPMGDATRPSPGGIGMFSGTIAQSLITRGQQSQDTLYALAKDTGGRATFDTNDLALGIVESTRAVTSYYILGYYTKNVEKDGRYRRVTVRLAPGLAGDLSYRAGYYGDKEYGHFNRTDKEQQLADALRLEDPITDIPMAAAVNYFQISSAEYFVPVSLRMPRSELTEAASGGATRVDIDLIGEIKDEYGVTYRNVRDLVRIPVDATGVSTPPMIQYETGFTMLPGSYVIKLLARNEATGRIGTYLHSFVVPNLEREMSGVRLSSVVLTSERVAPDDALFTVTQRVAAEVDNPLVIDGLKWIPAVGSGFSVDRPLFVLAEAYERDTAEVRPLVAYLTFYGDDGIDLDIAPVLVEAWNPKTRALSIRFDLAPGQVPAGAYMVQITVLDPEMRLAAFRRIPVTVR